MSLSDTFNYLVYKNPVSKATISGVNGVLSVAGIKPKSSSAVNATKPAVNAIHAAFQQPLWKLAGPNYTFVRVAALSGAAAICLAAYGKHKLKDVNDSKDLRGIYESANNMHLINSVVLLAVPLCRKPAITGTLFIIGTVLFSGTCYYKAIKKSQGIEIKAPISQLAPYGGVCLILGWLSFLL